MNNYERALKYFDAGNWNRLRQELRIPQDWWNTISKGICKTDEFKKVIEKRRDAASVFEELHTQLTTFPDHAPIPAPYTGDEAIEALRNGELSSWDTIATVMLHYPTMDGEVNREKTYCWSLYRLEWPPHVNKAAHAFALDPPFKTAMHLCERQRETEILDAFEISQSWDLGGRMCSNENFLKVLKYMAEKEVRGQLLYTKFSDVFSLIRGKERPQLAREGNWQIIATIVLDHGGFEHSDKHGVYVWTLRWNTGSGEYGQKGQWDSVYSIAADFHEWRHWAGLRGLFHIDETWWKKLLMRLCQQQSFGNVLNELKQKDEGSESIYPQFNNIFSWTRVPECKPENVKVIIVGQDPVHHKRATGMSFLFVEEGECESITNIFTSVKANFGIERPINHLCPYRWCQQGVLLLNTQMTIGANDLGYKTRHKAIGWEEITTGIIEYFIDNHSYSALHILLWSSYWNSGNDGELRGDDRPIQKLRERSIGKQTTVICNAHPSPMNDERFVNETTGQTTGYYFDDDTMRTMNLFREVNTVDWTTIMDGMPAIPAGVIHSTIVDRLPEIDLKFPK